MRLLALLFSLTCLNASVIQVSGTLYASYDALGDGGYRLQLSGDGVSMDFWSSPGIYANLMKCGACGVSTSTLPGSVAHVIAPATIGQVSSPYFTVNFAGGSVWTGTLSLFTSSHALLASTDLTAGATFGAATMQGDSSGQRTFTFTAEPLAQLGGEQVISNPEPGTWMLMLTGLAAAFCVNRRR